MAVSSTYHERQHPPKRARPDEAVQPLFVGEVGTALVKRRFFGERGHLPARDLRGGRAQLVPNLRRRRARRRLLAAQREGKGGGTLAAAAPSCGASPRTVHRIEHHSGSDRVTTSLAGR